MDALETLATAALDGVFDPELDEPITDLGFVRSLTHTGAGRLVVHLQLPTSFCSPNFAYLMASDAKDALTAVDGVGEVVVELDDHHDSPKINQGIAADAGYKGTFGVEAQDSLDELRAIFRRKAHTAAMERALTALLRADPLLREEDLGQVTIVDLPETPTTRALLSRRAALGLPVTADSLVLVDHQGRPFARSETILRFRQARSVRISIDGNAHFCRGLLATRYPETTEHPLLPLEVVSS